MIRVDFQDRERRSVPRQRRAYPAMKEAKVHDLGMAPAFVFGRIIIVHRVTPRVLRLRSRARAGRLWATTGRPPPVAEAIRPGEGRQGCRGR